MMEILIPILAVTVIGLICAVGLAVASSVMAVKEDTRFTEIRECLPGACPREGRLLRWCRDICHPW